MIVHVFGIKTEPQLDEHGEPTSGFRHRWVCSCHRVGPWKSGASGTGGGSAADRARRGGERHVAAMERGR